MIKIKVLEASNDYYLQNKIDDFLKENIEVIDVKISSSFDGLACVITYKEAK